MFYRAEAYSIAKRNSPPFIGGRFAAGVRALLSAAAVAAALSPVNVSALPAQLPADEDGLAELLSARAIDTFEYNELLAFYALPLSVPRGELAYLASAFPDIAEALPIDSEELSAYRPFDNRQVRRLFNDYPALAGLEPILRFDAAAAYTASNGEVVAGINRSSAAALRGHRIRFRRKGAFLSAEGGLALSDSAARLRNRRLDVSYGGASASIGNFKQPMPGELAFGLFTPLPALIELTDMKMSDMAADFLYGGVGAWNGVSVDVRDIWGARAGGAGAFCHLRPAEAGGGVAADVSVGKRARVFAGFTGFWLGAPAGVGAPDGGGDAEGGGAEGGGGKNVVASGRYYAHIYAEYKAKGVYAAVESAAPLAEECFAPALSFRLNYRVKESSAEYRAVYYPAGFPAEMSRLKKRLLAEAGEKEPSPPVQKHAVGTTVQFMGGAVKLIPELDFTECAGVKRVCGQARVLARAGGAAVVAKHAAKIFAAGADSASHASCVSINYRTAYPVEIRASLQSDYGRRVKTKNAYALEAPAAVVPSAVIAPYVRGKYAAANEYWLGIKGEFHLYKKTWTGITLETPVGVKGADNVYVKASSSYSF